MTKQEFLEQNNDLLIGAVKCKIGKLEQKNRYNETKGYVPEITLFRKEKIKKLAILLEWLESETNG
jgi:hypothetical protein